LAKHRSIESCGVCHRKIDRNRPGLDSAPSLIREP
jgi:hypothetical protein